MKVVLIGPAYPLRGGIANFNEALAQAFYKKDIDTEIISFSLQYPSFLFPGKTQFSESKAPEHIKITSLINSVNPFNWFKVARKIKKLKPDYVIVQYWMPFMAPSLGTICRRVKRHSNIKVISITHNIIPHEKFPFSNLLTKYFVNACNGFVTLSKSVINDLNKFTSNKNKIFLPHPIYNIFGDKVDKSSARNYLKLQKDSKYILFFGIIRKYKGLDLILEAMGDKRIKNLGIRLIVAGEFYEDKTRYLEIINNKDIDKQVIIADKFIPGEDIKYYFSAADIIVQPYRTATQSGVTQIAYNFEKPMLVADVGGLSEIVPNNKVGYVTKISSQEIANAIVDFYENNREDEFIKNVINEKKRFSWEKFIEGIFNNLC